MADYTKEIAVNEAVATEEPRHVAVEVRDSDGRPLMKVQLDLRIEVSAPK